MIEPKRDGPAMKYARRRYAAPVDPRKAPCETGRRLVELAAAYLKVSQPDLLFYGRCASGDSFSTLSPSSKRFKQNRIVISVWRIV